MTTDFISKVRKEQSELAEEYANETMQMIPDVALAFFFPSETSDLNCLRECFASEMADSIIEPIIGFTDWLACKVVRSGDFNAQALPVCGEVDLEEICQKFHTTSEVLRYVVARMTQSGTKIPLIGTIDKCRRLIPDEAALKEWAKYYKWD